MPCTSATAAKRVAKIESLVPYDAPVLILGDDDLVSIELARRGFTDVTAFDIDPKVIAEIRQAAARSHLKINCVEQDLQKPVPQHLKRDYRVVLFDSEYSLAGISLFLKAALDLTGRRSGTLFFVSVHLMSLFRDGISDLDAYLSAEGLELNEFNQGFNVYPTPRRLKGLIRLWNRIVIGSSTLTTEGHTFPFLLSDALLLRKL
jgi:predicted methyltransferase